MTLIKEKEKKINYSALSLLFAIILLLGLCFTVYNVLRLSGHPMITGAMGQTIEEREFAGQLAMEFWRNSLFCHIPIYLISLGLWIMAIVKKQKSKLTGTLIVIHLFVILPILYLVISK